MIKLNFERCEFEYVSAGPPPNMRSGICNCIKKQLILCVWISDGYLLALCYKCGKHPLNIWDKCGSALKRYLREYIKDWDHKIVAIAKGFEE